MDIILQRKTYNLAMLSLEAYEGKRSALSPTDSKDPSFDHLLPLLVIPPLDQTTTTASLGPGTGRDADAILRLIAKVSLSPFRIMYPIHFFLCLQLSKYDKSNLLHRSSWTELWRLYCNPLVLLSSTFSFTENVKASPCKLVACFFFSFFFSPFHQTNFFQPWMSTWSGLILVLTRSWPTALTRDFGRINFFLKC
jgi:hypothetical protein